MKYIHSIFSENSKRVYARERQTRPIISQGANKTIESYMLNMLAGISVFRVQFRLMQTSARAASRGLKWPLRWRAQDILMLKNINCITIIELIIDSSLWRVIEIISKDFKKMTKIKSNQASILTCWIAFTLKRNWLEIFIMILCHLCFQKILTDKKTYLY